MQIQIRCCRMVATYLAVLDKSAGTIMSLFKFLYEYGEEITLVLLNIVGCHANF